MNIDRHSRNIIYPYDLVTELGRKVVLILSELGYIASLFVESFYWLIFGSRVKQPVRWTAIFHEAMAIGVRAALIVSLLCLSVGVMLAIQGIETLRAYGAESTVVLGIALSITREFSPLIVSILVAGRSGSAIAARIGTMNEAQEIDALRVMGINPVRYIAAPIIVGMLVMLPMLTILGDFMGLLGGAIYTNFELNIEISTYAVRTLDVLSWFDIQQGIIKSIIFAMIIALVGISNGFQVKGGAEGVGRATTRSVVMSISLIVVFDMICTFILSK